MEIRDSKGMTEAEFLEAYSKKSYPRPYLTADVIAIDIENSKILLIKRKNHPSINRYAFPGGFANQDESAEQTAARELEEETGLTGLELVALDFFSSPGRDPRGWVVSMAYLAVVDSTQCNVEAGDDAAKAEWISFNRDGDAIRLILEGQEVEVGLANSALGFDHDKMLLEAFEVLGI